jgi:asparagine synthase (glutamine-hydrolysing)
MCGIGGIVNINREPVNQQELGRMMNIIRHRGPDDEGYLLINTGEGQSLHCHGADTIPPVRDHTTPLVNDFMADAALGFRRLSILDLSETGHQPMSNEDGSLWIVFNGEIYNYVELRESLRKEGYAFHSTSDTEVILKAYHCWGENCLERFNGMWAFAIWDQRGKKLFCARDRFGVKPFYYYFDGTQFIFGSEVKQILVHNIDKSLNEQVIAKSFAISNFLENSGGTYFRHIQLLPHAHFLTLKGSELKIMPYYDLPVDTFERSALSFPEACESYRELFKDSVKIRMRSDVEVGSALSGGLDSSAIVMLASGFTANQFQTFSSYFTHAPAYDERKWISMVVEQTNARAHYVSADPEQVKNEIEKIVWHHDVPLEGSSPVAQYYVMQLAHENKVTVLLDGQGSDEITGGYHHAFYRYYADLLRKFRFGEFIQQYPSYLKHNAKGSFLAKIAKTAAVLALKESSLYRMEARQSFHPLIGIDKQTLSMDEVIDIPASKFSNFLYNQVMSTSIQTLLHYEDRNSMAHSIESRVPFLDYRLVEFVFSLPSPFKIKGHVGKYIHREALRELVPAGILNRKDKVGFLAPGEYYWLRNEWKEFATGLLQSGSFRSRGIFDHHRINQEYVRFQKGDNRNAKKLWQVLMLELWFRKFVDEGIGI